MKNKRPEKAFPAIIAALLILVAAVALPVHAAGNVPVTMDIAVKYSVNGSAKTAGGDTFTLTPDDPSAPMPPGSKDGKKTIKIDREGTHSFGEVYCDRPEVWWYTIARNKTEKKGVVKDDSVYRAKLIALNDGRGYVLGYLKGSDKKHDLEYKDKVAPDTGDRGTKLYVYAALMAAAALLLASVIRNRVQMAKEKRDE